MRFFTVFTLLSLVIASPAHAQLPNDPYPKPINATEGVVKVNYKEFASLPDSKGQAARMMLLVDEPGSERLFVNDMNGPLYSVSYDGKTVTPYVDVNDPTWGVSVQFNGSERGVQSFAFHPQFNQRGARGYGKFYTLTDTTNTTPAADFKPLGGTHTHDTVLLEWTAKNPAAATYDGGAPRELIRWEQPFSNHNGGHITFNPLATTNSPDFGLLYRQDPADRSARHQQRQRQIRNSRSQSLRERQQSEHARGNLRVRRAQSSTSVLGSEDGQHVHVGHRPEHRRRNQPRHLRREPRLERLGG